MNSVRTLVAFALLVATLSTSTRTRAQDRFDFGVPEELTPGMEPQEFYGWDVAIDGEYSIVSAIGTAEAGAVFVFDGSGVLVQVIRTPDRAPGDNFGYSLSVEPGRLLVGAPGEQAAYLYARISGQYMLTERFAPSEPSVAFGNQVVLSAFSVFVGAPRADVGGVMNNGAVHRFTSDILGNWREEERIDGPLVTSAAFGTTLALTSGRVFVGAPLALLPGGARNGLIYVYNREGVLLQTIQPTPPAAGRSLGFGRTIVADGDWMMTTIRVEDTRAVVVYEYDGVTWGEVDQLMAPDRLTFFASDLALDSSTLLVRDFEPDTNLSAVRAYRHDGSEWRAAGVIPAEYQIVATAIDGLDVLLSAWLVDITLRYSLTLIPDADADGISDPDDEDDDNDGVLDVDDADPLNASVCRDEDADGCDDCSLGTDGFGPMPDFDPAMDGADGDVDGICDVTDLCVGDDALGDVDGDGICGAAGMDAGPMSDTGPSSDAGPMSDAGPNLDAGAITDAGRSSDTGTMSDAGFAGDTRRADGGPNDAGVVFVDNGASGCSCRLSGGTSPWTAGCTALVLLFLMRRRGHPRRGR